MAITGAFIAPIGLLAAATSATSDIESLGTALFFVGVAAAGVILVHLALCILVGTLTLLPLGRVVRTRRFRRVSTVAALLAIAGVGYFTSAAIALPSYAPRAPTSPHRPERGGPLSVHGFEPWDQPHRQWKAGPGILGETPPGPIVGRSAVAVGVRSEHALSGGVAPFDKGAGTAAS